MGKTGLFRARYVIPLLTVLGLLPVLPVILKGSPILNNDMLVAYFCYFWDFHRNWSWSHPLVFWSSSYQCGMPMHAYWQSGYLYPVTWILFGPISPHFGIYLFYAFHFALGIFGLLKLGPHFHLTRPASLWAGICFALSGTLLARYEHATFLSGWTWMPLVLASFLNLRSRPSPVTLVLYASAVALQALGGHPQASATTAVLIGAFTLAEGIGLFTRRPAASKPRPGRLLWIGGGHLMALCYCAPLVLPFLELVDQTNRYDGVAWEGKGTKVEASAVEKLESGVFGFEKFATGGMRPLHLLSLAAPHALGSPSNASWWGGEAWGEVFLYLGGLGLCFCCFASWKRANRDLRLLWLTGLFGLWLAFGAHLGASQILYHIPLFNNFRRPARYVVLAVLALAVLSGHGFQRWHGKRRDPRWPRLVAAIALLTAGALLLLRMFPSGVDPVLEWVRTVKRLDPTKDYALKMATLVGRWGFDGFFLAASGLTLWFVGMRPKRRMPALFAMLVMDLVRVHWDHFYLFSPAFYRSPPATLAVLDLKTSPYWRVSHYLEYPEQEMWQMHNDPLAHPELFEREKTALSCGIHAIFGLRHVSAHLPLLWKWEPGTTAAGKSTRYLFSNREMGGYRGDSLELLGRFGSVNAYELENWRPRIQAIGKPPRECICPAEYSGLEGLCVREVRDGHLFIRAAAGFAAGDSLIVRERFHPGWRHRSGDRPWRQAGETPDHFLALTADGEGEMEVEFHPWDLYRAAAPGLAASFILLGVGWVRRNRGLSPGRLP